MPEHHDDAPAYVTRDQKLAIAIYEQVTQIKAQYSNDTAKKDAYGSIAHRLPILIHTAGLAQAIAFVQARGKEPQHALLKHLAQVVLKDNQADGNVLASASRKATLREYIFLTQTTLDALLWFKRFAQSELDVTADTRGDVDER